MADGIQNLPQSREKNQHFFWCSYVGKNFFLATRRPSPFHCASCTLKHVQQPKFRPSSSHIPLSFFRHLKRLLCANNNNNNNHDNEEEEEQQQQQQQQQRSVVMLV